MPRISTNNLTSLTCHILISVLFVLILVLSSAAYTFNCLCCSLKPFLPVLSQDSDISIDITHVYVKLK